MDKNTEVFDFFPVSIKNVLFKISQSDLNYINEINITNGQPLLVRLRGDNVFVGSGGITRNSQEAFIVKNEHISKIYELITHSSAYAYNRFINDGFLTLDGGHRIGITGNCVTDSKKVLNVNNINSFCFRINHDISANIDFVYDDIYSGGYVKNTIIISPPGCGKTTFLRTIANRLAGVQNNKKIIKCTIIDERYEIAACSNGVSHLKIGLATSVISGCKKNIAIPMVVRTMTPDVVLTDELATHEDIKAIKYAKSSGCSVIATVHGSNENNNELKHYNLKEMFQVIIVLSSKNGPGTIEKIICGDKLCL